MKYSVHCGWNLFLVVAGIFCAPLLAQAPGRGQYAASAEGKGGRADVAIRTEILAGRCAEICPSSRYLTWTMHDFGETPRANLSIATGMDISVNGRRLVVPTLTYGGLYDVNRIDLTPLGSGFVLRIIGSDAAFGYTTRIYFDATGIHSMSDTFECGLNEKVRFVHSAVSSSERPAQQPAKSGVRVAIRKPGKTNVELETATGHMSASIQIMPFEERCTAACPEASEMLKRHAHGPVFLEKVGFFMNGKSIPPKSSNFYGEGIRLEDIQYEVAADPRWVSLRSEGHLFVLRIDGGEGATANFKEFRFDPQGVYWFTDSESPTAPVAVVHFYSEKCGP